MKKNILIISSYLPYPLNTGGNIGVFEMINHFRNIHNITFTFPSYSKAESENILKLKALWSNVIILPYRRSFIERIHNSLYYRIQHFFYKKTYSRFFYDVSWSSLEKNLIENATKNTDHICDRDFTNHINSLIAENSFDLIQAEFYGNISIPAFIKRSIPIIFIHHELRFIKLKREFSTLSSDDVFPDVIAELTKVYEISMLKQFDKVVLVSEDDKNILSKDLDEEKLYCSPLAIKMPEKKTNTDYCFNNILTFLGGENHYPNKDGLIWFLKNCFPILKNNHPQLQLHIIGVWSNEFIKQYTSDGIVFTGFVDDLNYALYNSIMIVPIRIGSGIRMKIIDAVNSGIPFITTSIGVEGWDFRNNTDCIIADTPDKFTSGLSQLISDAQLRTSLIKSSQDRLELLYSFDKAIEKRQKLYDTIL